MNNDNPGQSILASGSADKKDPTRERGMTFCTKLIHVLKVNRMFSRKHQQTVEATEQFVEWVNLVLSDEERSAMVLQFTEHNAYFNGSVLGTDERRRERIEPLREVFQPRNVNVIRVKEGLTTDEINILLGVFGEHEGDTRSLAGFSLDFVELAHETRDDHEELVDDPRRVLVELYSNLMIRAHDYFDDIRANRTPSLVHVKRIIQRITDHVIRRDAGDFVGLVNLRPIKGRDFAHAAHSAIYAMVLATAVGLDRTEVMRCGMTALAQDVDKIDSDQQEQPSLKVGGKAHFKANLNSVVALTKTGSLDVLSALRLVTNYERGFPFDRQLPSGWYEDRLPPHLLTKIIEIGRDYDILTQGLGELDALTPDLAMCALVQNAGSYYDPDLVKRFVEAIGLYPVGSVVQLSNGRTGVVVQSTRQPDDPEGTVSLKPKVQLLDDVDATIDLYERQDVQVQQVVDDSELRIRPGAFDLL